MSATRDVLRIIELVSARLCQDLDHAAVAGGAGPGVARMRLRQAAWAAVSSPMDLPRIAALATGLPSAVRLDVSSLEPTLAFPSATARIVLNLLLLAADSLPAGGGIVLAGAADDLFVQISGPGGTAWPAGLALCMADEATARAALADGDSLQMAIATLLAHALGIRLSLVVPPVRPDQPAILRLGGG